VRHHQQAAPGDETRDDVCGEANGFAGELVQPARNEAAKARTSVVARWKRIEKVPKPRPAKRL
jgi:hypothetical protein